MSLLSKLGSAIAGIAGSKPAQKTESQIIKTATKVTGSTVAAVGGNKAVQKAAVVAANTAKSSVPTVSGKIATSILKVGGASVLVGTGGVAVYDYLKTTNSKSDYTRDYEALVNTYKNETDAIAERQKVLTADGSYVNTSGIGSSGSNGSNSSGGSLLDYLNANKTEDTEQSENTSDNIKWIVGGGVLLAAAGLIYASSRKKKSKNEK